MGHGSWNTGACFGLDTWRTPRAIWGWTCSWPAVPGPRWRNLHFRHFKTEVKLRVFWSVWSITRYWSTKEDKCFAKVPDFCTKCRTISGQLEPFNVHFWSHWKHWKISSFSEIWKAFETASTVFKSCKEKAWNFLTFWDVADCKCCLNENVDSGWFLTGVFTSVFVLNCFTWKIRTEIRNFSYDIWELSSPASLKKGSAEKLTFGLDSLVSRIEKMSKNAGDFSDAIFVSSFHFRLSKN